MTATMPYHRHCLSLLLLIFLPSLSAVAAEVNVYSARKENLVRPLLDMFTVQTGIKVNLLAGKGPDLLRRLALEKNSVTADVFLATDAGNLSRAVADGLLQAMPATVAVEKINPAYRHPELHWTGLSLRARTIVYAKDRVNAATLPSNYINLADDMWRGKICVRSSDSPYNQSLVAALVYHHGQELVINWLNGLVANFARPPQGGDRDQIRAVIAGECDLALVNTYYLGIMLNSADGVYANMERDGLIGVHWPQQDPGVHINLSGAGIVATAANYEEAAALIDFMLQQQAQQWLVDNNHEYPVIDGVSLSSSMRARGNFKADNAAIAHLEQHRVVAIQLMDRSGWR